MVQTKEIINSQVAIINWLQRQATQQNNSLHQTKDLVMVIKQAIDCYEILLNTEERKQPSRSTDRVNIPTFAPKEEVTTATPAKDTTFYALDEAYNDAVANGCLISQGVFRKRLSEGASLYGWRKDDSRGNRPSYYKVF
jgi:hypothetical protein